jgi:hypothetical protein
MNEPQSGKYKIWERKILLRVLDELLTLARHRTSQSSASSGCAFQIVICISWKEYEQKLISFGAMQEWEWARKDGKFYDVSTIGEASYKQILVVEAHLR